MNEYVTVAEEGSIAEGQGVSITIGDRLVAVFNRDGSYHAINDLCPHMGASLGAGQMDEEGIVTCPWHAWRFNVCDGTWCDNPTLKIDSYETRVIDGLIQVKLPHSDAGGDAEG